MSHVGLFSLESTISHVGSGDLESTLLLRPAGYDHLETHVGSVDLETTPRSSYACRAVQPSFYRRSCMTGRLT